MAAKEGELCRSWLGAKEGNRCVMQQLLLAVATSSTATTETLRTISALTPPPSPGSPPPPAPPAGAAPTNADVGRSRIFWLQIALRSLSVLFLLVAFGLLIYLSSEFGRTLGLLGYCVDITLLLYNTILFIYALANPPTWRVFHTYSPAPSPLPSPPDAAIPEGPPPPPNFPRPDHSTPGKAGFIGFVEGFALVLSSITGLVVIFVHATPQLCESGHCEREGGKWVRAVAAMLFVVAAIHVGILVSMLVQYYVLPEEESPEEASPGEAGTGAGDIEAQVARPGTRQSG
ncbi:hypothetical protein MKZ38_008065 [Zalerion maritima]|uniref:Uncharacterized protein n=1 Tax=Zalerion maritima TaxID=339359 RepID=A0AAD5RHX8_9PEZI|nr:hypothetical protein MKZ38_008065 [Zalerion maritima]